MLVDSTREWFEVLRALDREARSRAPDVAREVIQTIEYEPASVTEKDVAHLKSYVSSENEIFNLILGAAAGAGLLRLEAALCATRSRLPTDPCSERKTSWE